MAKHCRCYQCGAVTVRPGELGYWSDNDGNDEWTQVELCSMTCVAAFAYAQALDAPQSEETSP
jgi:hypothetical protein